MSLFRAEVLAYLTKEWRIVRDTGRSMTERRIALTRIRRGLLLGKLSDIEMLVVSGALTHRRQR